MTSSFVALPASQRLTYSICRGPLEQFYGRVAELLAALLLARVDGKSPVEYITDSQEQDRVRGFATSHLAAPSASPLDLLFDWSKDACPMS